MKINIDYHGANLFICKKCQYARTKRLVAAGEDCVRKFDGLRKDKNGTSIINKEKEGIEVRQLKNRLQEKDEKAKI